MFWKKEPMNRVFMISYAMMLMAPLAIFAKQPTARSIAEAASAFGTAFKQNDMNVINPLLNDRAPVLVQIEHSIPVTDDTRTDVKYETLRLPNKKAFQKWWNERNAGFEGGKGNREAGKLIGCKRYICKFTNPESLSHTTNYLLKMEFRINAKGTLRLRKIWLLDGD